MVAADALTLTLTHCVARWRWEWGGEGREERHGGQSGRVAVVCVVLGGKQLLLTLSQAVLGLDAS